MTGRDAKERGLPGEDIHVAANYRDGCVWVTIGDRPRKCISPGQARLMAAGIESQYDLDHIEKMGYPTKDLVEKLRELADEVDPDS